MTGSLRAPQAAVFVAVLTCVAFLNSFGGQFVFDDIHEIQRNPAMERLIPPWDAMFVGNRLPARPLPYLTFAIDHALWGTRPFGYHITNLLVHVIAALALFDLVRLTLLSPRLRGRWGDRAVTVAMVIAMAWAVHPLQTQAVTYIYQRIESMTGMFCLVSLACFAHAAASGITGKALDWRWLAGSVAACAAAMVSKENAVVLPFLIVAYDWFFACEEASGSWPRSLWQPRWFYTSLGCTWGFIGAQLLLQSQQYQELKEPSHSGFAYALTQPGVLLHYLRLAVWPAGQQIDYSEWPVARSVWQVLPALTAVLLALAATAVGTVRRQPWASLPVLFFLTLAPTSSIMPIEAVANEHRMYVALAAVVAAVVLGLMSLAEWVATRRPDWLPREPRVPLGLAAVAILSLVLTTQFRNQLYSKVGGIWLDVLSKAPDNHRANWMLASILDGAGETEAAIELAERSIRSKPTTQVFSDLAGFHTLKGDYATAERICRRGLELQCKQLGPDHKAVLATTIDLAVALKNLQRFDEADAICRASIGDLGRVLGAEDPATISAGLIMAVAAGRRGSPAEAEQFARAALTAARTRGGQPDSVVVNATIILAEALRTNGRAADAESVIRQTAGDLRRPGSRAMVDVAPLDEALAAVFEGSGRFTELVVLRRRLMEASRGRLGTQDPLTRSAAAKLAEALAAQRTAAGDHAGAATLYRQLVIDYAASVGSEHPETKAMKLRLSNAEVAAARPSTEP